MWVAPILRATGAQFHLALAQIRMTDLNKKTHIFGHIILFDLDLDK